MKIIDLNRTLVLATASPARRKLVSDLGIDFVTDSVDIDESPLSGEPIDAYVARVARAKAEAVIPPTIDAIIISVDTAIGLGNEIIGKPADEAHAREILKVFSGRSHDVWSAIALRDMVGDGIQIELKRTEVAVVELSPEMIDWYIGTGEWKGRAGAYAIQGVGAALVEEVRGCFTNVIGISIPTLIKMLRSRV